MTAQERALVALAGLLEDAALPYMVIGGIANLVWGAPRATLDIDVTLWVDEARIPDVIARLSTSMTVLVPDPLGFVRRTRVLPCRGVEGVRVDVLFGLLSFEREAIERARAIVVAGSAVRFCTPEDLILHKVISDRAKDLEDARGVVLRQGAALDLAYLDPRVDELSAMLENPELRDRWTAWKREAGLVAVTDD